MAGRPRTKTAQSPILHPDSKKMMARTRQEEDIKIDKEIMTIETTAKGATTSRKITIEAEDGGMIEIAKMTRGSSVTRTRVRTPSKNHRQLHGPEADRDRKLNKTIKTSNTVKTPNRL